MKFKPVKIEENPAIKIATIAMITLLFEYVLGLRPDAARRRLTWHIDTLDEMGVERFPFGRTALLSLRVQARQSLSDPPQVEVKCDVPLELELVWQGGKETRRIASESR